MLRLEKEVTEMTQNVGFVNLMRRRRALEVVMKTHPVQNELRFEAERALLPRLFCTYHAGAFPLFHPAARMPGENVGGNA